MRRTKRLALLLAALALGALAACGDDDCDSTGRQGPAPLPNISAWPMHPIDSRFRGANSLGAGDVDGDGRTDYVTNYEFDQRYVIAFHPGSDADPRLPWPSVVAYFLGGRQDGVDTETAELADLDGDGNLDIVGGQGWHTTAFWEGQQAGIRVIWGPPRSEVRNPSAWLDGGRIPATIDAGHFLSVQPVDVNGDGALDILFGGRVHNGNGRRGSIKWAAAPREPALRRDLSRWTVYDIDPEQWDGHGFQLSDVDEDGDLDIADANADFDTPADEETVHWYENPGTGADAQRQAWTKHVIYEGDEFYFKPQIAVADLDRDGHDDLVVGVEQAIYWFRKTGVRPVRWERIVIEKDPVARWLQRPMHVVDLDGDGRLDLLGMATHRDGVIPSDTASVFWMRYTGDRPGADNWETHVIKWGSGKPMLLPAFGEKWDRVQFDDVDGDGDLDILANCEEWWEDEIELVAYWDRRVRPTSVAVVWFENRLHEEPYRWREGDGPLVIEAERFTDLADGTWYKQSRYAGFAGDGYVQDHNTQLREPRDFGVTSGLQYELTLGGGTYHVWLRRWIPSRWGLALGGDRSSSAHVAIDGRPLDQPLDEQAAATDAWAWVRAGAPMGLAAGDHRLALQVREGGYAIDRILLTADATYVPNDGSPVPSATPTPSRTSVPVPPTATPTNDSTPTPSATGTATASPTRDLASLATPVPGTSVHFDLDAELADPSTFYALPYPSDLRLDASGRPILAGFPMPAGNATVASLHAIADDHAGFSTLAVAYFRFSAALAPRDAGTVIAPGPDAPIMLIDVDPDSAERGTLLPVVASTPDADAYVPEFLLAVAAPPGIVLAPNRTYAVVVRRSAGDADGLPLGVPPDFAALRAGLVPDAARGSAARDLYRGLWETLDAAGIDRAEIAAATVFTTGDVVAEMARIADGIAARDPVDIEALELDPGDGVAHARFCKLVGHVRMPQFQQGSPPFNLGGLFAFGEDGLPIVQREQVVPVVLTVPRRPMPASGFPLVAYFHGSGGLSSQVVDRGPTTDIGGRPRRGEGPAHVLAAHGFATLGSAHPLNPERLPGAIDLQYINFANLPAYRDTFRQGTIEQRLLIDAVGRLVIDRAQLAGCDGLSLADDAPGYAIRPSPVSIMGQSMGAQYVNMVGATNPHVGAVVATGSGGMWSLLVLTADLVPGVNTVELVATLLGTGAQLTPLHPGLHLFQTAWLPADPIAYAGRIARRPLPGYAPRPIFQPVGFNDPDFPLAIYDAMALAHGNQQAGTVIWPSMQTTLALADLDGLGDYPVANNRQFGDAPPHTRVVVQYEGDGILSPHHIAFQLDAVKYQYGCFLATFEDSGTAVVREPQALGTACE